eukprot:gene30892-38179_t
MLGFLYCVVHYRRTVDRSSHNCTTSGLQNFASVQQDDEDEDDDETDSVEDTGNVLRLSVPQKFKLGVMEASLQYMSVFDSSSNAAGGDQVLSFGAFLQQYRALSCGVTILAVIVMLPLNVTLSQYFNTYIHEYAWVVSSAYLSGVAPAVSIIFAVLFIVAATFLVWRHISWRNHDRSVKTRPTVESHWSAAQNLTMTLLILLNIVLVEGVNVAYVYIHSNYSADIVQIALISVALFKVVWNNFAIRGVLKLNKQFIQLNRREGDGKSEVASIDSHVSVAVLIMLFNNLVAPFLATAFVSSNCFYNVVTTPPSVHVSYLYASCAEYKSVPGGVQCVRCALLYALSRLDSNSWLYKRVRALLPSILRPSVRGASQSAESRESESLRAKIAHVLSDTFKSRLFDCDLYIGRYVVKSRTSDALRLIEKDCGGARAMFLKSLWIAAPFALLFYCFLLFDILGDTLGYKRAIWLPISIICVPVLARLGVRFKQYTIFGKMDRHSRRSWSNTSSGVELDEDVDRLSDRLLDDDGIVS